MLQDPLNKPIFITGIERSGSSLMARIIGMCGAYTGFTTSMSENIRIRNLVDAYYKDMGMDSRGQYPLPDTNQMLIPADWNETIVTAIRSEGYNPKLQPWMYKGSRIAQIWPVWHHAFPDAKWIIVRRRTGDVVESCMKTGFMNAYKDKTIQQLIDVKDEREGWLWWVHQHEKLFMELIAATPNTMVIWPERMLDGNFDQIHEMLRWINLPWDPRIISLLEATLIKSKKKG